MKISVELKELKYKHFPPEYSTRLQHFAVVTIRLVDDSKFSNEIYYNNQNDIIEAVVEISEELYKKLHDKVGTVLDDFIVEDLLKN